MKVCVSNKIRVCDYTKDVLNYCYNNLVLPNPEYHKLKSLGKWTGNVNREIVLYEKDGNDLILPFGCLNGIWKKHKSDASWERNIGPLRAVSYGSNIKLYDYQERAVKEALNAKNGVIVMPCGSGKTQTALELISRIGGKCLWLTHTKDLLNQSMARAKSVYGIDSKTFGTITSGKVNIGTSITFATVQTMVGLDLKEYTNCWDIVVVDECHKAVGSPTKVMQFYKVLSNLCCRYKYGLTATPKRADSLQASMFALIGPIVTEVKKDEVKNTTCPVYVEFYETGYMPNLDVVLAGDGTLNYGALVDDMVNNEDRFKYVLNIVDCLDGPAIVLANRVEYLREMHVAYNRRSICLSGMSQSKKSKQERKEALIKLNNGELDCIFATYALAKEGLDVPNLRYVVLATPEKDETTVTQSVGRVARKADGKEFGTVIDFSECFGMYIGWEKKRRNYYKKLDYHILT